MVLKLLLTFLYAKVSPRMGPHTDKDSREVEGHRLEVSKPWAQLHLTQVSHGLTENRNQYIPFYALSELE